VFACDVDVECVCCHDRDVIARRLARYAFHLARFIEYLEPLNFRSVIAQALRDADADRQKTKVECARCDRVMGGAWLRGE
jgi:hypothetical protein